MNYKAKTQMKKQKKESYEAEVTITKAEETPKRFAVYKHLKTKQPANRVVKVKVKHIKKADK